MNMSANLAAAVIALLVCSMPVGVRGEVKTGTLDSKTGFEYLGKFCYDYTDGDKKGEKKVDDGSQMTFELTLKNTKKQDSDANSDLQVLVYDDESSSWPSVYHQNKNCQEKMEVAKNAGSDRFHVKFVDGKWKMSRVHVHEHIRPRFWYVVVANCKGFTGLEYEAKFINQGGILKRQFGVNEQGINLISTVFFASYICLCLVHIWCVYQYKQQEIYHPLIQVFSISLTTQALSFGGSFIHTWVFTFDGKGVPACLSLSEFLAVVSRLFFVLFLILVAQGWATVKLSISYKEAIFSLVGALCLCYFALLLWDIRFRDPASTLYLYESIPGLLILVLDVISTVWFVSALVSTCKTAHKITPEKSKFLKSMGYTYVWYLLSLPAIVLVACFLKPWVREWTVSSLNSAVTCLGHAGLLFLFWPSRVTSYFKIQAPDLFEEGIDKNNEKENLL